MKTKKPGQARSELVLLLDFFFITWVVRIAMPPKRKKKKAPPDARGYATSSNVPARAREASPPPAAPASPPPPPACCQVDRLDPVVDQLEVLAPNGAASWVPTARELAEVAAAAGGAVPPPRTGVEAGPALVLPEHLEDQLVAAARALMAARPAGAAAAVSGRLSLRRLARVYDHVGALLRVGAEFLLFVSLSCRRSVRYMQVAGCGFAQDLVEQAMTACAQRVCQPQGLQFSRLSIKNYQLFLLKQQQGVPAAGDVLDWLCLHAEPEQLPPGFSERVKVAARTALEPGEMATEAAPLAPDVVVAAPEPDAPAKLDAASKEWILQYAEQAAEDDAAAETAEAQQPEDPQAVFERLSTELAELKLAAAQAKADGDGAKSGIERDIQQKVAAVRELRAAHPGLAFVDPEPPTTAPAAARSRPKTPPADAGDNDGSLSLFDLPEPDDVAPDGDETDARLELRAFSVAASWSGLQPKELLAEFWRKQPLAAKIKYRRVDNAMRLHRYCVVLEKTRGDPLEFAGNAITKTTAEGQNLAATVALYALASASVSESLKMRLAPAFRAVWDELAERDAASAVASSQAELTHKLAFLQGIMRTLQTLPPPSSSLRSTSAAAAAPAEVSRAQPSAPAGSSATAALYARAQDTAAARKLSAARQQLPVLAHQGTIVQAVRDNPVILIR